MSKLDTIITEVTEWASDLTKSNWSDEPVLQPNWTYHGIQDYVLVPVNEYHQYCKDRYDWTDEDIQNAVEYEDITPTHMLRMSLPIDTGRGELSYFGNDAYVYDKDGQFAFCNNGGIEDITGGGPDYQDAGREEIVEWLMELASLPTAEYMYNLF